MTHSHPHEIKNYFVNLVRDRIPIWRSAVAAGPQSGIDNQYFDKSVGALGMKAEYDPRVSMEENWEAFEKILRGKVGCLMDLGFEYEAQLRSRLFSAEERVFAILFVADWFLVHRRAEWQIDLERSHESWRGDETARLISAGKRIIAHFSEKAEDTADLMTEAFCAVERYALAELDEQERKQAGEDLLRLRTQYVRRLPEIREFMVECMLDAASDCDFLTEVRTEDTRSFLINTEAFAHILSTSACATYYDKLRSGYFDEPENRGEHDPLQLRYKVFSKLHNGIKQLKQQLRLEEELVLDLEVDIAVSDAARREVAEEFYGLIYRLRRAGVEVKASVLENIPESDLSQSIG